MKDRGTSVRIHNLMFKPLITAEAIQKRVQQLGEVLYDRYAGQHPLFIGVLNGAFVFTADLVRAYADPCEIAFVRLASYAGTASSGTVQTLSGLDNEVQGRQLIIVEDILDTGRTLHHFVETLKSRNPAGICIVTCLRKPESIEFPIDADYAGFDIGNAFVVGYGLDYDGLGRNLPGIYVLEEEEG